MVFAWGSRLARTVHNRHPSLGIFLVCGVLALVAAIVGISDNPPGL